MEFPVLVEPIAGGGFRAKIGGPFDMTAEGATSDEAVARIREQVARRTESGAVLRALRIAEEHPFARSAGRLKGHPLLAEWKAAMAEYRRQADQEA